LTLVNFILKIECWNTHIYMKTECLQTKWDAASFWWKGKDIVLLIKSLIYVRVGRGTWGEGYIRSKGIWSSRSKMYADASYASPNLRNTLPCTKWFLPSGVNFINVLRVHFLEEIFWRHKYKSVLRVRKFWRQKILYEKCARKRWWNWLLDGKNWAMFISK